MDRRNRNKRPIKPKHNDIRAIDGIVAGVMALGLAMRETPNNTPQLILL